MGELKFDSVEKSYQRRGDTLVAINGLDLTISDNEFVSIVGPSGCGKTTLLKLAAGLERPSGGTVSVGGVPITGPGPDRAVVFQQFALFPWKSVWKNIEFGLKCTGVPRQERYERIEYYLAMMGLTDHKDAYPDQLSGGMQQRVAIARSYVMQPQTLLMDEPFGSLDAQTRVGMQEELIHISRNEPRTTMLITHSVDEAIVLGDRIVVMSPRPAVIREIIDVSSVRKSASWDQYEISEVLATEQFNDFKTRVWSALHQQNRVERVL